ncbi:hypothetical protein [Altererythrobacter sp. Root672]|uniref:hypothetical protein n=1 Tax=Altererythrobacter sp. Root672 TaxID=1736584 RepID=UPI0006F5951F|nr:hypothetical protein [Altererythrobacter sp. Root672]KRA84261.1 hypothetical protein ASD76_09850 [Altererythrobacter sp. Root672]
MTPQDRMRRIGWLMTLAICTGLYLTLHLKVHAVVSDVVRAERQIVALEQQKLLLETEFETRSNQLQLAVWNQVDFGYTAPTAAQFIGSERQLASFGTPRGIGAPEPIRVAGVDGDAPEFPKFVSPITGKAVDPALIEPERVETLADARPDGGAMRIPLRATIASIGE